MEAMRAGQVEQLVLLPNQDLVQVQFKYLIRYKALKDLEQT